MAGHQNKYWKYYSLMEYSQKRRYSRAVSLASYWGLLGYFCISPFIYPVAGTHPLLIIAVKTLPLIAFAPGVLAQNRRHLAWLCFVLLIYFTFTVAMWQPQSGVTMALIVSLFVSAMMHSRWHNRAINGAPIKKKKRP